MDLTPDELVCDLHRTDGRRCGVRVTHLPSGKTASAEDGETVEANRIAAVTSLSEALGRGA